MLIQLISLLFFKKCLNLAIELWLFYMFKILFLVFIIFQLKNVTAVSQLPVFLFAGPLWLSREQMEKFDLINYTDFDKLKNSMTNDLFNSTVNSGNLVSSKDDLTICNELDSKLNLLSESIIISNNNNSYDSENNNNESDTTSSWENDMFELELEPWLLFNSTFENMHLLVSLRFKLMNSFLNMIKNPLREFTEQDSVNFFK